jgi:hypothetical protein
VDCPGGAHNIEELDHGFYIEESEEVYRREWTPVPTMIPRFPGGSFFKVSLEFRRLLNIGICEGQNVVLPPVQGDRKSTQ